MVILHGMRYHQPIQEECIDVAAAIQEALGWLPNYVDNQTIGWAAPLNITDTDGNELVSEDDLREQLSDLY